MSQQNKPRSGDQNQHQHQHNQKQDSHQGNRYEPSKDQAEKARAKTGRPTR